MDPITLAALAQSGISLGQMAAGAFMPTPERPQYEPPQALTDSLNIANREANASMAPGQAQMQNQIQTNTANTMHRVQQNATSSSDVINSAGMSQMGENRSLNQLYQQSLGYQDRVRSRQMDAMNRMAMAQNQAFQYNQQQPYDNAMATRSALFGAGMTGLGDSLGGMGAILQANQGQPKQPVPLPSAPQAQNYSLSEMTNMDANESWLRLQERMRSGLNQ